MNKYGIIAILILLTTNVGSYYYFNARIDSKDSAIALEQSRVSTLREEQLTLKGEIESLKNRISFEETKYLEAIERYEEYKRNVAAIRPQPVPSIKPIIITQPAEVVVETANEDSNEVLSRIANTANIFSGMLLDTD